VHFVEVEYPQDTKTQGHTSQDTTHRYKTEDTNIKWRQLLHDVYIETT